MIVSGFVGLAINCQSFCDSFRICVTGDSGIINAQMNKRLCFLIEKNIRDEMERVKDLPMP